MKIVCAAVIADPKLPKQPMCIARELTNDVRSAKPRSPLFG